MVVAWERLHSCFWPLTLLSRRTARRTRPAAAVVPQTAAPSHDAPRPHAGRHAAAQYPLLIGRYPDMNIIPLVLPRGKGETNGIITQKYFNKPVQGI